MKTHLFEFFYFISFILSFCSTVEFFDPFKLLRKTKNRAFRSRTEHVVVHPRYHSKLARCRWTMSVEGVSQLTGEKPTSDWGVHDPALHASLSCFYAFVWFRINPIVMAYVIEWSGQMFENEYIKLQLWQQNQLWMSAGALVQFWSEAQSESRQKFKTQVRTSKPKKNEERSRFRIRRMSSNGHQSAKGGVFHWEALWPNDGCVGQFNKWICAWLTGLRVAWWDWLVVRAVTVYKRLRRREYVSRSFFLYSQC